MLEQVETEDDCIEGTAMTADSLHDVELNNEADGPSYLLEGDTYAHENDADGMQLEEEGELNGEEEDEEGESVYMIDGVIMRKI